MVAAEATGELGMDQVGWRQLIRMSKLVQRVTALGWDWNRHSGSTGEGIVVMGIGSCDSMGEKGVRVVIQNKGDK